LEGHVATVFENLLHQRSLARLAAQRVPIQRPLPVNRAQLRRGGIACRSHVRGFGAAAQEVTRKHREHLCHVSSRIIAPRAAQQARHAAHDARVLNRRRDGAVHNRQRLGSSSSSSLVVRGCVVARRRGRVIAGRRGVHDAAGSAV
jgi:hypothetical protein